MKNVNNNSVTINLAILLFTIAIMPAAFAKDNHQHSASIEKVEKNKIKIKVNGMVCAFCAQGVEKHFQPMDEVKKVDVNLDAMEVTLFLNKGKTLTEKQIKEGIEGAGFAFVGLLQEDKK